MLSWRKHRLKFSAKSVKPFKPRDLAVGRHQLRCGTTNACGLPAFRWGRDLRSLCHGVAERQRSVSTQTAVEELEMMAISPVICCFFKKRWCCRGLKSPTRSLNLVSDNTFPHRIGFDLIRNPTAAEGIWNLAVRWHLERSNTHSSRPQLTRLRCGCTRRASSAATLGPRSPSRRRDIVSQRFYSYLCVWSPDPARPAGFVGLDSHDDPLNFEFIPGCIAAESRPL